MKMLPHFASFTFYALTCHHTSATTIATDLSVPAVMDAGGSNNNEADYIIGDSSAVTLNYGTSTDIVVGSTTDYNKLFI